MKSCCCCSEQQWQLSATEHTAIFEREFIANLMASKMSQISALVDIARKIIGASTSASQVAPK